MAELARTTTSTAASLQNFRVAVALNNVGAGFVPQDLPYALECFSHALELTVSGALDLLQADPSSNHSGISLEAAGSTVPRDLWSTLSPGGGGSSRADTTTASRSHAAGQPQEQDHPRQQQEASSPNQEMERVMMQNAFVAAMVMTPSEAFPETPLCHLAVASVVVIFNVAVVCHRTGLEGNGDNQSYLNIKTAQTFYHKVQDALGDLRIPLCCSSGHAAVDLLIMAVHNNLGQISHYLAEFEASSRCFHSLVSFCDTVNPACYDQDTAHVIHWHKCLFLYNARMLPPPTTAPTA